MSSPLEAKRFLLVTLGCFRNEVESDLIRSELASLGMDETQTLEAADIVVVNTCGFIAEACDEGIDTVLELDELTSGLAPRPPVLAVGCMAERYGAELMREMPEIDGVLGVCWQGRLAGAIGNLLAGGKHAGRHGAAAISSLTRTVDSSENATLYIRVADGCDRGCRFCTIPSIRGPYRSRPVDEITDEIRRLGGGAEREVILLAQDLSSYGKDLGRGVDLTALLRAVSELDEARWVRMLYLQPEGVSGELVREVGANERVCDYFDIPFQHASSPVLRRMGRPGDASNYLELIESIRRHIPDAAFRTTMMVGYPGETEEDFRALLEFVEEARFDWMGAFVFSCEEGTPAAALDGQVPSEVAVSRYNTLVELQEKVEESGISRFEGRRIEVVIDGDSELDGYDLVARSYREAPVVDGVIHLRRRPRGGPAVGDFAEAKITGREGLDLAGEA